MFTTHGQLQFGLENAKIGLNSEDYDILDSFLGSLRILLLVRPIESFFGSMKDR